METKKYELQNFRVGMEQLCGEQNRLKRENQVSNGDSARSFTRDRRCLVWKWRIDAFLTQAQRGEHTHAESVTCVQFEINKLATTLTIILKAV